MKRKYLLRRDRPDERDFHSMLFPHEEVTIPTFVNLRKYTPKAFDQGQWGSCTANAGVRARIVLSLSGGKLGIRIMLSRMGLYKEEKIIEGAPLSEDSGAEMRDIGKALTTVGVAPESDDPYTDANFATPLTFQEKTDAAKYRAKFYQRVIGITQIKQYIALHQQGVLIGMDVYESMEGDQVAKDGILPMPGKGESLLGGHALYVEGYDDNMIYPLWQKQGLKPGGLIIANSWGISWADKGYFFMNYKYVNDGLAYDSWIIQ